MPHKNFKIIKVEELPDAEALITGEITLPFLVASRAEAIKSLNKVLSLPGFRQGHIPEDVLVKNAGEMRILEETAEIALAKEYMNILEESKVKAISRPEIAVTKLAPSVPLEFKLKVPVEPQFDLPDYKKIAKEVPIEEIPAQEDPTQFEIEKSKAREKRRLKIIENIVKDVKLTVPKMLVEAELHHMMGHFKADVEKAGVKWDEYMKKIEKTEDEIRDGWREQITERAKAEFILSRIAREEKLDSYQKVFDLLEA